MLNIGRIIRPECTVDAFTRLVLQQALNSGRTTPVRETKSQKQSTTPQPCARRSAAQLRY
ncbi:hypothetical protein M0802_014884 [Mischocyttarus mexicanus]|nr:hypothetical protein M0802_014884 [Mischocyttarus mexicanus]